MVRILTNRDEDHACPEWEAGNDPYLIFLLREVCPDREQSCLDGKVREIREI